MEWLKYKNIPLRFCSYYKWVFLFKGIAEDGTEILVNYGDPENVLSIYRYNIDIDKPLFLDRLYEYDPNRKKYQLEEYYTVTLMRNSQIIFKDGFLN